MVNWKIDNGKLNIQGIEDFEEQIEYAKSSLQYKKIEKSCKRNEKTIAEKDIMIKNLEDFGANEKVIRFWKPEKKWYNATVLEKTKSGYKVVFADGNLVRALSLQNLRKKTSR
ncbi:uncharacterized protein LOC134696448 isoform X1 [Mytilus trossulus]|uniref:uncharacterized protein LOC134696448 isoform X1 n=1 Tax=Mytilus trossulus TaxID=6551 RepID=UPI0030057F80